MPTERTDMCQLRVDGRVVAEVADGTLHVYDDHDDLDVEVRDGWPGT